MDKKRGPKSLREAIEIGMSHAAIKDGARAIESQVLSFLAHHFARAVKADPKLSEFYKKLFDEITEISFRERVKTLEEFKKGE